LSHLPSYVIFEKRRFGGFSRCGEEGDIAY